MTEPSAIVDNNDDVIEREEPFSRSNVVDVVENVTDYVSEILVTEEETGDNNLNLRVLVVTDCENCGGELETPVFLLVSSQFKRDSALVCKVKCVD